MYKHFNLSHQHVKHSTMKLIVYLELLLNTFLVEKRGKYKIFLLGTRHATTIYHSWKSIFFYLFCALKLSLRALEYPLTFRKAEKLSSAELSTINL